MKTLLIAMTIFLSVNSAFACSNPEAQFIGNVSEYNSSECSYKIEFSRYNESMICPLSSEEAASTVFVDKSCSLKNGDMVSGYLIVSEGKIVIE